MRDKIIEVLIQIMGLEENSIDESTVIREIPGFDSLQYVMMISELQETYHIEIPLDKAIEISTIGELIECARETD